MCSICHSFPHLPGCPEAPEPIPIMRCRKCGEGIFASDKFLDTFSGPICDECLEEMTVEELLEELGERLSVA